MLPVGRVTDLVVGHCKRNWMGMIIIGSTDYYTNNLMTARIFDMEIHSCKHGGVGFCITGSNNYFVDNRKIHRLSDVVIESSGGGITITGSPNSYANQ